jgi:hypothetical protein
VVVRGKEVACGDLISTDRQNRTRKHSMLKLSYRGHDCCEFDNERHRALIDRFLSGKPTAGSERAIS